MPNRFASFLIASILGSASVAALAQSVHEPPRVVIVDPASAQTTSAPSMAVSPSTVQAAPDPKMVEKQTYSFVKSYAATPNPVVDQIGRWHEPVCVQVSGLSADQAAAIKARIGGVAQAQGLPAAPAGCKANVEIVFTDQPQSTMDLIAQRQEPLLGYYHHGRVGQLKTVTHPIQAWYITATRSEASNIDAAGRNGAPSTAVTGSPSEGFSGAPASRVQSFGGTIDDPESAPPSGCLDRFASCYTSVLYNVLIVADGKALAGKDMGLVADDMVMLALSQPRSQDGCNVLPSVIDVFAKAPCPGRDPPTGLTSADSAYLSALYASQAKAKKADEQSDIANRMAKILIKANAVAAAGAGSSSVVPNVP